MHILNLTQHVATPEQLAAGVFEPSPENKEKVKKLLTFTKPPSQEELADRAQALTNIAMEECGAPIGSWEAHAMIGGAGWFVSQLETTLWENHVSYHHSFTERVSVEEVQPDGTVKKTAVFKHVAFVPPLPVSE